MEVGRRAAVHVIDENAMADADLVDIDELPENPDER